MNWFIFALGTALFWGTGQIFIKKGLSSVTPLWNNIFGALLYFLIFIPIALASNEKISVTLSSFLLIMLASLLYILYYYALEKGLLSLAGTIIAMYPVITIILSVIFLKETLSLVQISMIMLILLGGYLLSQTAEKKKLQKSWIAWALLGAFAVGTADFLAKVIIQDNGTTNYNFLFPFAFATSVILYGLFDKKGRKLPKKVNLKSLLPTLIGVAFMNFGLLSFNYALSLGSASLVSSISSSYVGITLLLAFLFLKESLNKKQLFAVLLILIGIIFLSF